MRHDLTGSWKVRAERLLGSTLARHWTRVSRAFSYFERLALHAEPYDQLYNRRYYATYTGGADAAAIVMAGDLVEAFDLGSVVDVGCGSGEFLRQFQRLDVEVLGLERSYAALEFCRARSVPVERVDLELDSWGSVGRFDAAISFEVAEHLTPSAARRFVSGMTQLSDLVLITAAGPGQGGTDHVNEQPMSYWFDRFEARGYKADEAKADDLKSRWAEREEVPSWYTQNFMVFRRDRPAGAVVATGRTESRA